MALADRGGSSINYEPQATIILVMVSNRCRSRFGALNRIGCIGLHGRRNQFQDLHIKLNTPGYPQDPFAEISSKISESPSEVSE